MKLQRLTFQIPKLVQRRLLLTVPQSGRSRFLSGRILLLKLLAVPLRPVTCVTPASLSLVGPVSGHRGIARLLLPGQRFPPTRFPLNRLLLRWGHARVWVIVLPLKVVMKSVKLIKPLLRVPRGCQITQNLSLVWRLFLLKTRVTLFVSGRRKTWGPILPPFMDDLVRLSRRPVKLSRWRRLWLRVIVILIGWFWGSQTLRPIRPRTVIGVNLTWLTCQRRRLLTLGVAAS